MVKVFAPIYYFEFVLKGKVFIDMRQGSRHLNSSSGCLTIMSSADENYVFIQF